MILELLLLHYVQMLTLSTERFRKIQKEAPLDCHKHLVQVTKYQAAQNCKVSLFVDFHIQNVKCTTKLLNAELFNRKLFFFLLLQTWIVGKWITPREQKFAPAGTHFHQFVVPPILHFRRDCTYGDLAAMKLPQDVQGLGSCEVNHFSLFMY